MKLTFTEHREILAMYALVDALLIERAALKQEILDLNAGDAAMAAKVQAAFDKSEVAEAKLRGVVAGR